MIAVVNRVRIDAADQDSLRLWAPADGSIQLTHVGQDVFRRADGRGLGAFHGSDSKAQTLTMITDSGFPAVYERISLIATLRAQIEWIGVTAMAFLYAAVWRPLASLLHRNRATLRKADRRFRWLSGTASTLNLVFMVGFPLAFFGHVEGGLPEFVYGVPLPAKGLLFIPPVSALLSIASAAVLVDLCRDRQLSRVGQMAQGLVVLSLLGFVLFVWFWRLTPET